MGQRFQSVFILPSIYMNENNPNNRSEKVLVFHNHWLYGRGAININLLIIERLKTAIFKKKDCGSFGNTKKDFINHFLEDSLLNAINWASIQSLHNETRFHKPEELIYSEEDKKPKEEQLSLKKLLQRQDNNNGFFICRIRDNLKIEYAFISGFEDEYIIKYKNPKEYLSLFYKDKDLIEEGFYKYMEKQIKSFSKFKAIPKEDLIDTIKYLNLNEHKPKWAI